MHAVSEHRSLSQSNLHVCDWSQRAKTTCHVTAANLEKMAGALEKALRWLCVTSDKNEEKKDKKKEYLQKYSSFHG